MKPLALTCTRMARSNCTDGISMIAGQWLSIHFEGEKSVTKWVHGLKWKESELQSIRRSRVRIRARILGWTFFKNRGTSCVNFACLTLSIGILPP